MSNVTPDDDVTVALRNTALDHAKILGRRDPIELLQASQSIFLWLANGKIKDPNKNTPDPETNGPANAPKSN